MRYSQSLPPQRRVLIAAIFAIGSSGAIVEPRCFAGGHTHGPIYRTLDALAGGIEKVIDVVASAKPGSMGRNPVCDDGCDAALMGELGIIHASPDGAIAEDSMLPPALPPADQMMAPALPAPPSTMAPSQKPLMAPVMPQAPRSMPKVSPVPPSSQRSAPQSLPVPAPAPKTADDEWLDSFSNEPAQQSIPRVPQRQPSSPPQQNSGPGGMRRPSDTFDSMPNPFLDDPQSSRQKVQTAQPASYWEPW
jgi:hypothetical protein